MGILSEGATIDDLAASKPSDKLTKIIKKLPSGDQNSKPHNFISSIESEFSRSEEGVQGFVRCLCERTILVFKNSRGTGITPPPPKSMLEALFVFVGVFVTLLTITALNRH